VLGLGTGAALALGYAFVTEGWLIFPLTIVGALQMIAYPALNAVMSRSVGANVQGELQGGIASLSSIANIVGPLSMSQVFAFFTSSQAPVHFPGAAFILTAVMNLLAIVLLLSRRQTGQRTS
jgi:DHA1 family tetracycline resistance protein-like MFS transporter